MSNSTDWVIELSSPTIADPIRHTFTGDNTSVTLGRKDAHSETQPDIDLAPFGAGEKGVSRLHVRLSLSDGHLIVEDLGASNGTTLNGNKLTEANPQPLNDQNTLGLGALQLKLRVVSKPGSVDDKTIPKKDGEIGEDETEGRISTDRLTKQRDVVLVVEDHVEVAQLFSMILQKNGFDTHISRDATRAMRYLQNKQPDAVILDLMLPGMDGTEVCRYIRRDSSLDQTAIIIVSANRNPGTERAAYDAGADAFISKPVNAEELGKTVKRFIRKRKAGILDDETRELTDRDATKGLSEQQILEMDAGVGEDTMAVVVAGYTDRPFTVTVNKPMTFGRGSYSSPATHVDLSRFNAKDKGVSRMHIRMTRKPDGFHVEDMDSMNGTYLNGKKLPPSTPTRLRSGQEIRIGQLAMTVYFMSEAEDKEDKKETEPLATKAEATDTQEAPPPAKADTAPTEPVQPKVPESKDIQEESSD